MHATKPAFPAFLIVLLLLTGCVAAPVQEMSNARQAISAAEDAGAQRHAPEKLRSAQALLQSAEKKLEDRNYLGARQDAVSARFRAVEALESMQPAKENGNP